MSGKKGKSGRMPRILANHTKKDIDAIKINVHAALKLYTSSLLKKARKDECTPAEGQQLATLHMKYIPDQKADNGNEAYDVLRQMAIEGAKEFARIKASKAETLHNEILAEAYDVTDSANDAVSRETINTTTPND